VGAKTTLGYGVFTQEGRFVNGQSQERAKALADTSRSFKVKGSRNKVVALNVEFDGKILPVVEVEPPARQAFFSGLSSSQIKKLDKKGLNVTAGLKAVGSNKYFLIDLQLVESDTMG
jgi:hypothetical protein